MILVSSCLAGNKVRYDGGHCLQEVIEILVREGKAVTVCPEVMGGMSTPREPSEIIGGDGFDVLDGRARVVSISGVDLTDAFLKGANEALQVARKYGATTIVLKEESPSCGSAFIYDGTFTSMKISGHGVTAALFKREGYDVYNEKQWLKQYT